MEKGAESEMVGEWLAGCWCSVVVVVSLVVRWSFVGCRRRLCFLCEDNTLLLLLQLLLFPFPFRFCSSLVGVLGRCELVD